MYHTLAQMPAALGLLSGNTSRLLVIAAAMVIVIAIVIVFIMVLRSDSGSDSKTSRGLQRDLDEGPAGKGYDDDRAPGAGGWNAPPARAGFDNRDALHRPGEYGGTVGGQGVASRPQQPAPGPAWSGGRSAGPAPNWGDEAPAANPAWNAPPPRQGSQPVPANAANPWGQPASPAPTPGRGENAPFGDPGNWPDAQPSTPAWGDQQGWAMPNEPAAPPRRNAPTSPPPQQGWAMPNEPAQQGWAMPNEPAQQGWAMPNEPAAPAWQGQPSQPMPQPQAQQGWAMPNEPAAPPRRGAPATPPPQQGWAMPNEPSAPAWRGGPAPLQEQAPVAARPDARVAYIIIREGKEPGRTFELRKDRMTIGRSRESEIFLEDLAVSRLHASIYRDEQGGYILRDENSANGTSVNGQRVSEHRLNEGDEIQVGQTTMTFTRR